ncbi:MAG: hypothetical protein J6T92_04580 [Ottowia sp.]|nr:hypothetical protein [Ottowia sp.]
MMPRRIEEQVGKVMEHARPMSDFFPFRLVGVEALACQGTGSVNGHPCVSSA